jgi:transposase
MKALHARCAGLDVHAETVVAAVRIARGRKVHRETRTFGTTTKDLLELGEWLEGHGVKHAVMETTGVFWKPVWHVLAGGMQLTLAHASHVKNVPGRKSDASDAEWLSDLLAHGLVTSSFVPPEPIQELRDLTRTRKQLVRERARHVQRIQKMLESANVKLTEMISDVVGLSGRAMLEALIRGETDPVALAKLANYRVKAPQERLVEALRGRVTPHHRFMLKTHLGQVDALDTAIASIDAQIQESLFPFRPVIDRLMTMPGIDRQLASVLVAEMGADMSRFPTPSHLVSWAGLCPRMDESAGRRRSTRVRKGAPWLKTALVQGAWASVRKKDSYHSGLFLRIKSRRGAKKAILAVAASMLTAAYFMIERGANYQDLGPDHHDRRNKAALLARLARRIKDLGYEVTIEPAA